MRKRQRPGRKTLVHSTYSKAFVHGTLAAALVLAAVSPAAAAGTAVSISSSGTATAVFQTAVSNAAGGGLVQTAISREEAVAIAQRIAGSLDGFPAPEVSQDRWHGEGEPLVWQVRWMQNREPYQRVEVVIDAQSGRILEFENWPRGDDEASFPPKVSYEQAVKIGEDWLAKLAAHLPGEYALPAEERDSGQVLRQPGDTYTLMFQAMHDGIPFPPDSINLSIDGDGNLRGLHTTSLPRVVFADKAGLLEEQEIRQKLAEQMEMELAYTVQGEGQEEQSYVLSYVPVPDPYLIDAKTGQLLDYYGEPRTQPEAADQPLGAKTDETQPTRAKPVTEAEALAILQQFFPLPEEVVVTRIAKEKRSFRSEDEVWSIQLEYRFQNGGIGWDGAEIAAESGKLIYFNLTPYLREKFEEKNGEEVPAAYPVSWEKAKETALSFVKKQARGRLHELYWGEMVEKPGNRAPFYRFTFERKVDGIRVLGDDVQVQVSAETGEIVSYYENWDEQAVFPQADETVDPQEAKQRYIDEALLNLRYHVPWDYVKESSAEPVEAMLVYELQEPWEGSTYIDARTGTVIDRQTGEPAKRREAGQKPDLPADIVGHPHEEALRHLVSIGALQVVDGGVQPEKVVSRAEFLDIFLHTLYELPVSDYRYLLRDEEQPPSFRDVPADHPYFVAVQWAVEEGLIAAQADTFAPDSPITREDAAQILVTALGYQKLAELDSLFALPFADRAEIEQQGYVAIASKIGLISGTGERFEPDAKLTRAEVATILYRFLSKRAAYRPEQKL